MAVLKKADVPASFNPVPLVFVPLVFKLITISLASSRIRERLPKKVVPPWLNAFPSRAPITDVLAPAVESVFIFIALPSRAVRVSLPSVTVASTPV